ncbi:MAG TPA: proton-conducting transporter membrane subunit, partial [Pirellulaceae bacterium]|nr:proton-conducting transporter membrane subunit [Pirellulaceae bacterium]
MAETYLVVLSLIVFLPVIGAIVLAFLPGDKPDVLRNFTLAITAAVFLLTLLGLVDPFGWNSPTKFDAALGTMQTVFNVPWIPSFDIYYYMGLDGISFPLVVLTALVSFFSMWASWSITKHVKAYCILFLLLETGMMGVFMSLDFFLFYVFWEVMLLPMYFLIGVWGGPRREYAAIKFFLYTLVGSVLMLVAILMLYFASDVRGLAEVAFKPEQSSFRFAWNELHVSPTVNAQIGLASTATATEDGALGFLRNGAKAESPLKIEFVSKADAAETSAAYDAETNAVTVNLAKDKSTAADVLAAINLNPALAEVVAVALPSGAKGAGVIEPANSLEIPAYTAGAKSHTFNLLALAAMGQHTTQFDGTYFGKTLQW